MIVRKLYPDESFHSDLTTNGRKIVHCFLGPRIGIVFLSSNGNNEHSSEFVVVELDQCCWRRASFSSNINQLQFLQEALSIGLGVYMRQLNTDHINLLRSVGR